MKWYISAQNEERTITEHFWIGDKSMRGLRKAAINGEDFVHELTCEGCAHKQPCYDFDTVCDSCSRCWPDLYEVVSE